MDDEAEEDDCLIKLYPEERSFDVGLKTSDHVDQNPDEVSLREWLDQPKRPIDLVECLHIFRQVVETVNIAHSLNVVLNNVRPSCFVMSTFYCVSFIESTSCSSSASESSSGEEDSGRDGAVGDQQAATDTQLSSVEDLQGRMELDVAMEVGERRDFPLKKILNMEFTWYSSPEEAEGGKITFASDIYKLGVLLFELFCTFDTLEEKISKMATLKHRLLPPQMLFKWPKEASFCLRLLHPQPNSRPTMSELLQSELFNEIKDSVGELEAAIKLNEGIHEQELTLDFLQLLQRRKLEDADKLHDIFGMLSADIEEVDKQRSAIMKSGCSFLELEKNRKPIHKFECLIPYHEMNEEDSSSSGSRKRIRQGHVGCAEEHKEMHFGSRAETNQEIQEKTLSKSCRIMKNLQNFEAAYFSSRCSSTKPVGKHTRSKLVATNLSNGSTIKTVGSSVNYISSKEGIFGRRMDKCVNPFFEDLCKYLSFSQFKVLAELKQRDLLNSSNLICSLAFDRDKEFFATASLNRKIKVFDFDAIINQDCDIHYPVTEMASRSKLCNVCWNGYIKNHIASSDFEGVVQVWDVTRSEVLLEMREHEKRVWSVNYSLVDPTKLASGSDDGTVKLWKINQGGSTGTIRTKANVCSVEFPPDSSGVLAIGSADHNVYCYDLRNMSLPLCTFVGHAKTVSYVKFVDSSTLVSSSTDNSLKLWDLSVSTSRVLDNPIRTFTGHTNVKNFVGLSISDGYIATGSETNEVFVYQKAFPMPVFSYKFGSIDLISGFEADDANQFVSCVCWRGQSSDLVATNSNGNIKVLEMV